MVAWLGPALGLAGTLFGNSAGRRQASTDRAFQTGENQASREFANAMDLRNREREVWDRHNDRVYFDQQRQRFEQYTDPAAQRARLEAAGVNPLGLISSGETLAGGGGGGGGGRSSSLPGHVASPTGGALFGSGIGDAFRDIGDGIDKIRAAKADATAQEQKNEQLQKLVEKTTLKQYPGVYGGNSANNRYSPHGAASSRVAADADPLHPLNDGANLNVPVTGGVAGNDISTPFGDIKAHPLAADGEVLEERYGDLPSVIPQIGTMLADGAYTIGRNIAKRREKKFFEKLYADKYRKPTKRVHHAGRTIGPKQSEIDDYRFRRRLSM